MHTQLTDRPTKRGRAEEESYLFWKHERNLGEEFFQFVQTAVMLARFVGWNWLFRQRIEMQPLACSPINQTVHLKKKNQFKINKYNAHLQHLLLKPVT